MTLWALYHRAAKLARAHLRADARTAALDVVDSRRIRLGNFNTAWRRAGARAAKLTMDRGYAAAVARLEARERMLFDPFAAEEERKMLAALAKYRVANLQ